jgi:hypothetical protein
MMRHMLLELLLRIGLIQAVLFARLYGNTNFFHCEKTETIGMDNHLIKINEVVHSSTF